MGGNFGGVKVAVRCASMDYPQSRASDSSEPSLQAFDLNRGTG